jgi:DNA (cytosine-5)-methyltransferase 1
MHKAIDLFSGCGGVTRGLKLAGFRVVGAIESDDLAVETYKANHPEVFVWSEDIRTLPVTKILKTLGLRRGELDLLAGCPPCQGFSTMTTLNGRRVLLDKRNDLVFEFLRFVSGLRPKAIMMENVPGLSKDHRLLTIRKELRRMGYLCNEKVLNAANYAVPQRRKRFILLAGRGEKIPFARPARKALSVRDALRGFRGRNDVLHNLPEHRSKAVQKLIRSIPKDGGSRLDLGISKQLDCHRRCDGFKDVYGRMAWGGVAPTITGGFFNPSKGRFLHPTKNRAITLREAALLQTFPPTYYFSLCRGKIRTAQMIGNAFPPEFVRRHASSVSRFLRSHSFV